MSLRDRILQTLQDTVGSSAIADIADEESLLENGAIDSITMLQFANALGERFQVTVENDELMPENLDSIAAIRAYLRRKGVAE
jgi:acyl carrier protein